MNQKIVRALSPSESFYVDFKISVQMVSQLKGMITAEVVQMALDHLVQRHPFLSCRVIRENENLYFVRATDHSIPLQVMQNKNRDKLIHDELNTMLDETQHLIRVVMLVESDSSFTLLFTVHHAIIDGLSSMALLNEFLTTCSEILEFGAQQTRDVLPIQNSIEDLSSHMVTPAELSDFIDRFAEQARTVPLQAIEPLAVDLSSEKVFNNVMQVKFSREETERLIQNCKAKKVTVHSVIAATHLIAIRQQLDARDTELMLRCNTPVDLRQRLHPPLNNEHLLSAATGCGTNHAVSPTTNLWELAKEIGADIQMSLNNREEFKGHLSFMDTLLKHHMPNAIGVSSVGLLNIPTTYHGFDCHDLSLTGVYRLPMFGVTVYTFNNQLVMIYLYVEPYYSPELIQKLGAEVKFRLNRSDEIVSNQCIV